MKVNQLLTICIIFLNINCKSQIVNSNNVNVIEVQNIGYSKIPPKYDISLLSKVTTVDKKYFSSGLSFTFNNKKIDYPINDKVFNHEFFNNFIYGSTNKIKLYVREYNYQGKVIQIVEKIE